MKNINRKTRIFLGVATAISLASAVAGMIKVRSKYKKQDRFCEFEGNAIETEDDIQFWEEEYLKEEEKSEEEKQQEFIPEKADGSIEIAFEINGTDLSGKTAVIYEEIKIDGKSIAEHKNPEAKEQSIYFPKIGTKAMDKKSKTQEGDAREKQTIIDQVSYENLLPGETYILKGVLMDKADGKEMTDKNNRKITGRTTFTPEKSAGTVEMTFELDARELGGKAVVVFENLYDEEDHLIADEANIDNADQTIIYKNNEKCAVSPKINTDNPKPSSSIRKSPKTGVENHTFLWMLTLGSLGTAVAAGIAIYRKKRD